METIFAPCLGDAFERAGMHLNGREPEPGRLLRFSTNGRDDDKAGWCRMFPDGAGAVFGDWRGGDAFAWQQRDRDAPPPSAAERAAARAKADAARLEAERERAAQHAKAAKVAATIWGESKPLAGPHDYLDRKGVQSHGARLDHGGALVLPVHDAKGRIQSLQFIDPKGDKRFLPGGAMKGGRLVLGELLDGKPIALAEGFATAASVRESTGLPVVVGFSRFEPATRRREPAATVSAVALNRRWRPRRQRRGEEVCRCCASRSRGRYCSPADVHRWPRGGRLERLAPGRRCRRGEAPNRRSAAVAVPPVDRWRPRGPAAAALAGARRAARIRAGGSVRAERVRQVASLLSTSR